MLHLRYYSHLTARQLAESYKAIPSGSKVLAANTLHFKPIFDPRLKKVAKRASVLVGVCTNKTWSFSSACKNLGAQIWDLIGA